MSPKVLGVIPARLASTRLPRKVLRELAGEPCSTGSTPPPCACPEIDDVVIAADSPEVAPSAPPATGPAS